MNRKSIEGNLLAFIGAITFLVLGFWMVWFAKTHFFIQQDAVLITLLIIPIIVFLILSGKLQEFSAGGVSAKFKDTAQEPLFNKDEMNIELIDLQPTRQILKFEIEQLTTYLEDLSFSATSEYLVLTVNLFGNYENSDLLQYLKALSRYPNFKFLVILDQSTRVFAYAFVWQAIQIIEFEEKFRRVNHWFSNSINNGEKDELLEYYKLISTTLLTTDTKYKALEKMTEMKMDALIVTNEKRKLQGVVEREQLLNNLILALTK